MNQRIISAALIAMGLLAGGFLSGGRYTIVRDSDLVVWRLDRLTGDVALCGGEGQDGTLQGCSALKNSD